MTDEGDVTSADQDAWTEIARRVRTELEKRVPEMGAMNPTELKVFVETLSEARWFNERVLFMDKTVELELQRAIPSSD